MVECYRLASWSNAVFISLDLEIMTNNIPLEGRIRLPNRINDCIHDCSFISSNIVNSHRGNDDSRDEIVA
ncbi:unnamed protein product [Dracunculus medinensis]|uniref:Neur_chan_LBD domain-containing protein n=1 Tax=Dracunculus medinensis TaxID=318479 RepID=A0A0N4U9K9_DRAME|nr:unnamed protein product [Dracunculus medinensis]